MAEATLHGNTAPINLGGGYTLVAPGLKGKARVLGKRATGSRGPELASAAFDEAFARARVEEATVIELQVSTAPLSGSASAMRGPDGADSFELGTPDFGPEFGQVVLAVDEAGGMHWHFPIDTDLTIQPSTARGADGSKVFRIPREVAVPPRGAAGGERGLVSAIGSKLLKVLLYPVADAILGPLTAHAVGLWEEHNRPHRVRLHLPGDRTPLMTDDWQRLASGRSLLFVHGTFSTSEGAFGELSAATLAELATRYGNRVFAFDHPTLSVDPEINARWFLSQVPDGVALDVDIVSHSRGGLVSRSLATRAGQPGPAPQTFKVRRLILVGVPNQGTLLAHPDHMVSFLDRITTVLNLFPDNGVTDVLEGILTVVKVIGHSGLSGLDGLAAMKPGSPVLATLDGSPGNGCEMFGLGADFEPQGAGLGAAFCTAADILVDRIFADAPNDLVVPTDGMRRWNGRIQIPDDRFLAFTPDRGVVHTRYFTQPDTSDRLLAWLTGTAQA